ncbi:MAG TPA: sn-glycerol-1-phosphate dehydrogenase [Candidatus Nitrosotalea sp.]|nr:sn-glycerol-1-phosphate dehydrogenase [Candidatus Nitrosotalea sp.]
MTKFQVKTMASHIMELPRKILIGENNISDIGNFLVGLSNPKKVSLVSGDRVRKITDKKISSSLSDSKIKYVWHRSTSNDAEAVKKTLDEIRKDKSDLIIGIGGGRSVDIAKMTAFTLKKSFVSIPTSASHDGIASPFVSIRGDKPYSIIATAPLGVFVDIAILKKAPRRLLASGCGDLMAKVTAVRDWELARDNTGEYFGTYAANLASMSAKIVIDNSKDFRKNPDVRMIVEALISSGVAACIAGSSRPCSGAEHLFSHAVDHLKPGVGLHGEKCGIGAILIAKLQGQDWKKIIQMLKNVGAPTKAKEIGLESGILAKALTIAQSLRPERYTILSRTKMTEQKAIDLAKDTGVL